MPRVPIGHPHLRPRRLRANAAIRQLVSENSLCVTDLLYPLFVTECSDQCEPITSLPGQHRYPLHLLRDRVRSLCHLGLRGFMLFPVNDPRKKDATGSYSQQPDGLVCQAIRMIKDAHPETLCFADIALDPYTNHGHDGIIGANGDLDNDLTVEALCAMSLVLAEAGADFLCPSDMMDGRVGAIRSHLDTHQRQGVGILSYTAKFASAYYGPFRDAVGQTARNLDKSTYQISPANRLEALREAELDVAEGADIIMVKPGGPYLDILRDLRERHHLPIAVYQVSGEYAMIKAAAEKGWLDEEQVVMESTLAFKRAGASLIATYFAEDIARRLAKN